MVCKKVQKASYSLKMTMYYQFLFIFVMQWNQTIKRSAVEHFSVHWNTGCKLCFKYFACFTRFSCCFPICVYFSCCSLIVFSSAAKWVKYILTTQTTALQSHMHQKRKKYSTLERLTVHNQSSNWTKLSKPSNVLCQACTTKPK